MKIVDVSKHGYPDLFGADWDRSPQAMIRLWRLSGC